MHGKNGERTVAPAEATLLPHDCAERLLLVLLRGVRRLLHFPEH